MAQQERTDDNDDALVIAEPGFLQPDPDARKRAIEAFADLIVDALTRNRP